MKTLINFILGLIIIGALIWGLSLVLAEVPHPWDTIIWVVAIIGAVIIGARWLQARTADGRDLF